MKQFKGTQGKWHIVKWIPGSTNGVKCEKIDRDGISVYSAKSITQTAYGIRSDVSHTDHNNWGSFEGAHIAEIPDAPSEYGRIEVLANVYLIAAAPELLKALQKTVAIMGKLTDANLKNHYAELAIQFEENIKVITKALGE